MPLGTFRLSGCPGVNVSANSATLEGYGANSSILTTTTANCDVVQVNGNFSTVANLGFRSSVARTGGSGLRIKNANGNAEHLRFDTTYDGVQITDNGAGSTYFSDIQMGSGLSTGGNWNCGVEVGGVPTGTVTSVTFDHLFISTDAPFTDAAICVYDGSDTVYFYATNVGHVNGVPAQAVHVGRKVAGSFAEWVKFVGGNFEADNSVTNVLLDEGRDVEFIGATIQSGLRGVWVKTGCFSCELVGGQLSLFQQEAVKLSNGFFSITGTNIGEAGQQTDNTYDSIHIDAGVDDFTLSNIIFGDIAGTPANTARYNIYIEAGDSDRYAITNANCGEAHSTIFDGGTGTSKIILNPDCNGIQNYGPNIPIVASFSTASGADNVTLTGMTSGGHCHVQPTNAGGAAMTGVYVSAKTTNQITVTHSGTTGGNFDVSCTPN
jgi:hypothetical protein